jgi:hypothetical protein
MTIQEIQNMFNQINKLNIDLDILVHRHQRSPCISLTGLRNLELYKTVKQLNKEVSVHTLIDMLFKLLKIPNDWILQTSYIHQKNNKSKYILPFEVFIYLTNDSVKLLVYRLLLKHIRKTKQKSVHVKLINSCKMY